MTFEEDDLPLAASWWPAAELHYRLFETNWRGNLKVGTRAKFTKEAALDRRKAREKTPEWKTQHREIARKSAARRRAAIKAQSQALP